MRAMLRPVVAQMMFADGRTQSNGIQRIVVTRKPVQAQDGTNELCLGQAQKKSAMAGIDQQQRVHDTEFDGAKVYRHTGPQRIHPEEAGNGADRTAVRFTDRPASA